jgi:DNA-binding CsgD family transcriptional regulator
LQYRRDDRLNAFRWQSHDYVVLSYPLPPSPATPDALERLLSPAERQVASLLLIGRSYATIARIRGTAARTVANQVASAFRKLGVRSRFELAARLTRK